MLDGHHVAAAAANTVKRLTNPRLRAQGDYKFSYAPAAAEKDFLWQIHIRQLAAEAAEKEAAEKEAAEKEAAEKEAAAEQALADAEAAADGTQYTHNNDLYKEWLESPEWPVKMW